MKKTCVKISKVLSHQNEVLLIKKILELDLFLSIEVCRCLFENTPCKNIMLKYKPEQHQVHGNTCIKRLRSLMFYEMIMVKHIKEIIGLQTDDSF